MVTWGNNTTATFGKGTSAAASTTPAPATGFSFGGAPAANTQHPSTPPAASQPAPSLNPPPIIGNTNTNTAAPAAGGGGLFGSNPGMLQLICVLWGICYSISHMSHKSAHHVFIFFVFATALCINITCIMLNCNST